MRSDLDAIWQEFLTKIQEYLTAKQASLDEREDVLSRKLAGGKLIEQKNKDFEIKLQEFNSEKGLMEKQKLALRDKQQELEDKERKIKQKQEQIQRALEP